MSAAHQTFHPISNKKKMSNLNLANIKFLQGQYHVTKMSIAIQKERPKITRFAHKISLQQR